MILWTIKPAVVYEQIIESGVYRCNPALVESKDYVKSYLWLVRQMEKRIGPAPKGVTLPVLEIAPSAIPGLLVSLSPQEFKA